MIFGKKFDEQIIPKHYSSFKIASRNSCDGGIEKIFAIDLIHRLTKYKY